jgi:hypothetical protein
MTQRDPAKEQQRLHTEVIRLEDEKFFSNATGEGSINLRMLAEELGLPLRETRRRDEFRCIIPDRFLAMKDSPQDACVTVGLPEGIGPTSRSAARNLANQLAGKTLVINDLPLEDSSLRHDIELPGKISMAKR